jgi:ligand-binding sensor domain-containing protein
MAKYIKIISALNLFAIFLFITSCNGQVKSNLPKDSIPISKEDTFPFFQKEGLDFSNQISEYVVSILEDKNENLWFGTISDGAVRYNEKELTYFSTKDGFCDNTVVSIAEDKQGNLWFGTHNGISKYDGKQFTNFKISGGGGKIFIDSKQNIWAGTDQGAFKFDGISFIPFSFPKPNAETPSFKVKKGKIWSIIEDHKGNIWFGSDGNGVYKYDGKTFNHFTQKDGLCSDIVSRIVEDKKGNIWFGCLSADWPKGTKDGGLCMYDGHTFKKFPNEQGLHNNDIYSIYVDKTDNVWIGATGFAIYRYNGQAFGINRGTDRMDLTWSFGVQSILEDKKGTMWFGFSGGLFRFDGKGIVNVDKDKLVKRKD